MRRRLRYLAAILALGPVAQPGLAQDLGHDQIKLFAPAPSKSSSPSLRTPLVVYAARDEPPLPIARPTPENHSILTGTDTPPTPLPRPSDNYEPQTIASADGVHTQFDIAYETLPGFRPLTLDLYTPRTQSGPVPLVLFVHGGDWSNGDSRHAAPFADFPRALAGLAAQGYVVASLNYRLSQEAHFPAALQDVKAAIRWLRGHAVASGGDPTRLALWGVSAGAQLASLAGVSCGVMEFEPKGDVGADAPSDCADAVIDWYGPTDLQTLAQDNGKTVAGSAEVNYLGCDPSNCVPGLARLSSPLAFISVQAPPFLIQHGLADTAVSPKQSQKLYDKLKAQAVPVALELYPDVGHDFWRDGAPDTATVDKAMARLIAFLAATFPNKPAKSQIRHTMAK
jgi:acetyl esterase/lipase